MIFEAIRLQHSTHHSLQLHSHQHQQQLQNQHNSLQHRFLEDNPDLDRDQRHQQLNGDDVELKLKSLDFGLTKRLLAAVFFLLVIYAWKQYIDEDEESDTIYI